MTFETAIATLSRDDRFKATVYAMNTLLLGKGIYTAAEFEACFVEWAESEMKKREKTEAQS